MSFTHKHSLLKADVEEYLKSAQKMIDAPDKIVEAINYSLMDGGKRLRPVILLYIARKHDVPDEVSLPLCAALEMIHTYSLIHDDLPAMDNDELRRGKPTSHVKFGEDIAILAGDALLNLAFEHMLENCPTQKNEMYLRAMKVIAKCSGAEGMIGGQVLDVKNTAKDIKELKHMHELKTGRLFNAAVLIPVILAELSGKEALSYEKFSINFGLLFQITDDILDVTGEEETLGKSVGKDIKSGKTTYVSLLGLEEAKRTAAETEAECLDALKELGEKEDSYLTLLIKYIISRKS